MPQLSVWYFRTAILFLVAGICVGLYMSITHQFEATGAHAHINLLGWVTMAIFGIYYALNPVQAASRIAKIQYMVYTIGILVMAPSLFLMLTGNPALEPVVAVSSLVTFAGVLLFAVILFTRQA
jgi:NADH:ubiquinone oxidoreductase subunit 3 (subunit A)